MKKMDMKCRYKLLLILFYLVCTLISDRFHDFIEQKIVESNNKNDQKTNSKFSVLPSFAKVFDETNFVSSEIVCLIFKERRGKSTCQKQQKKTRQHKRTWKQRDGGQSNPGSY